VGRAEGATGEEGGAFRKQAGDGVELGDFERLGQREGRQAGGEAPGEPGADRPLVLPEPGGPTRRMFATVCGVRVQIVDLSDAVRPA
jgi:hypothetical protein